MELGARIRWLRHQREWNQAELGQRIGVGRKQVSAYERGVQLPSTAKLVRLAEVFGVTMDSLVSEAEGVPVPIKIRDRELLERFEQVDELPEPERSLAKSMLDLVLVQHRFQELAKTGSA